MKVHVKIFEFLYSYESHVHHLMISLNYLYLFVWIYNIICLCNVWHGSKEPLLVVLCEHVVFKLERSAQEYFCEFDLRCMTTFS